MSDINKIVNVISDKEPEFGQFFKQKIEQLNAPITLKNFVIFGQGPGGVSLKSGIYIHDKTLNVDPFLLAFIVLHEIGHYKRYEVINYDIISLTELPIEEYLEVVQKEEDFANNFAIQEFLDIINKTEQNKTKLLNWLEKMKNNISKAENDSNYMSQQLYGVLKKMSQKYEKTDELMLDILSGKIQINENKEMNKEEQLLRKKISETLKQLFEKAEVAPAPVKPAVKPEVKPEPKKEPRRLTKPKIYPGADPAPKAENKDILKKKVKLKEEELQNKFIDTALKLYVLNENPLQYSDDEIGSPNKEIKKNIEQRGNNPFSKIDILHKDVGNNQTSIERLSDEEYKDVVDMAKKHNAANIKPMEQMNLFMQSVQIQEKHKANLEQLAKSTVQHYFGIPDDVMENIFVKLTSDQNEVQLDNNNQNQPKGDNKNNNDADDEENKDEENNNDDLNNNKDFQELVDDFTPEEVEIIKQNVDKRTIANALMMGAGFRAHNLLEKIKPALDAISPELYPFYIKLMSGGAMQLWKVQPVGDGDFEFDANDFGANDFGINAGNKDMPKIKMTSDMLKKMGVVGKSELILGDDKNGDGIREVEGARAIAMVFPVLLHETVKACIEYIFASGLPQYTKNINSEIIRQADNFKFEYWHKLLGPRLWKYLHDAIDYIVKERGNDYTIVAYLLQEISVLPPNKFLRLIDLLIHDGAKGVVWLEKMLDRVEADLQNVDIEEEPVPQADFNNIQNLMGQIQNMLQQPGAEPKDEPIQQRPFSEMSTEELQNFILDSINAGDFEKAAEAKDELEKRQE